MATSTSLRTKTAAHRKHHAHCAQSRRGHHFRVKGQIPYQAFSVPHGGVCQQDPDEESAARRPSSGNNSKSQMVLQIEANNNNKRLINNKNDVSIQKGDYPDSIFEASIIDNNYSKVPDLPGNVQCDSSDHVCLFHAPYVLGEDPKYYQILKQYNTRVSTIF